MKKVYYTLYESNYYKNATKKLSPETREGFDEIFQAANIIHLAVQKCVGDHGKYCILHHRLHENNELIKRVLKKYPYAKTIIEEIQKESIEVNKGKFDRAIEDRVSNTVFVIEEIERLEQKKTSQAPEEME